MGGSVCAVLLHTHLCVRKKQFDVLKRICPDMSAGAIIGV